MSMFLTGKDMLLAMAMVRYASVMCQMRQNPNSCDYLELEGWSRPRIRWQGYELAAPAPFSERSHLAKGWGGQIP